MNFERFMTPYEATSCLPGHVVAVLAPHPDDEVFGCGGTLHALANRGAELHIAVVTDGAGFGQGGRLALRRCQESRRAAQVLGYPPPAFWELADGQLLAQHDLGERIDAWLAELKPDLLLAPSVWEMHRDHRAVAEAALDSVSRLNGCRLAMYEIGRPLPANRLVDITAQRDLKREAMQCFASQLAMQDYGRHIAGLNTFRTYTLDSSVKAAEAFCLLESDELGSFQADLGAREFTHALQQAEAHLKHAEARQQHQAAHIEQLQDDYAALMARNQATEAALRNVLDSRSWRVTAPLRRILTVLLGR